MEQDVQGVAAEADRKYAVDDDDENAVDENNTGSRTHSDAN